jgi:calcium-dependent protein kinase
MGCSTSSPENPQTKSPTETLPSPPTSNVRRMRKNIFGAIQASSITEHYELIKATGSDSIGTLFSARHIQSQEIRTLREINKLTIREEAISLSQEVSILKELDHPNIRRVFECIETPRNVYISQESISGLPLNEKITNSGCETLMYKIILEIFSGLNYLHSKGIAHCSLCPEFVIQNEAQDYLTVSKIVGFQAAQRLNDKQEVQMKKIRFMYSSPELLRGEFDEKTDLWSCGIILYDILVGKLPFLAKTKVGIMECILKGELDFNNTLFTSLTNSMQNLIKSLLIIDPSKRLTTSLALSDPSYSSCMRRINVSLDALSKLKNFQVHSAASRSILTLMNLRLGKEDHEIVHYFKELDENFDGKVSKEELLEAYDRLGIDLSNDADEIIANLDLGGNGFIDYTELKVSLMNWSDELKEKNLVKVFNASDRRISVDDLRLDLIDVKQKDWNQFLRDCPNDGLWIDLAELKKYLRANIVQ